MGQSLPYFFFSAARRRHCRRDYTIECVVAVINPFDSQRRARCIRLCGNIARVCNVAQMSQMDE